MRVRHVRVIKGAYMYRRNIERISKHRAEKTHSFLYKNEKKCKKKGVRSMGKKKNKGDQKRDKKGRFK